MSQIVAYPAQILREPCIPATVGSKAARDIGDRLQMILRTDKRGVALSAPQINESVRIFALDTAWLNLKCFAVFVNPEVTWQSEETDVFPEGCLSFPKSVTVPVRRSKRCTISAYSGHGAQFTVELFGMAARAALHECEHLNGITILDHATPSQRSKIMKAIVAGLKMKVAKK